MAGRDVRGDSDERLLAEACAGSEEAFRHLVERYHPMVYAVARGILGDRWDVEDVVQEVFIKVYRGLGRFRGDAKLSTWVYAIARNEALNAARREGPETEPVEDAAIAAPREERPDHRFDEEARRAHLERCLAELDERYRVVLELRYMGEMSYQEISEATGFPMGTVKTMLHRAKIELKHAIARKRSAEIRGIRGKGERS